MTEHFDMTCLAPPHLRAFAIAFRPSKYPWPDRYSEALLDARIKFNAGSHEMAQGRAGDTIIQYLIPRKVACAPRPYFNLGSHAA